MSCRILVINPGSTSTKLAIFNDELEVFSETIEYSAESLKGFGKVVDQFEKRKDDVYSALEKSGYDLKSFSAVSARGGMLPPVKSGAYLVNDEMTDYLRFKTQIEHASNLGALIAKDIAEKLGLKAYIYDSVRVDELQDIARVSGMPEIPRTSTLHTLNSRAMAIKYAKGNKKYSELNLIVAHLGGGISISVHNKGRIVDIVSDDEGPFSPERAGRVPCKSLIDLCFSGKYDKSTVHKMLRGKGGLLAYLGTSDARQVERMIAEGDEHAKLIYEAMAYQVAKSIGELATVVDGNVDAIILTGGLSYSEMLTNWIKAKVKFIAPVVIMAGENEMEALATGALRVLNGEEESRTFTTEG